MEVKFSGRLSCSGLILKKNFFFFQPMSLGKLDAHRQKLKVDSDLTPHRKINFSKSDLKVRAKTTELLDAN